MEKIKNAVTQLPRLAPHFGGLRTAIFSLAFFVFGFLFLGSLKLFLAAGLRPGDGIYQGLSLALILSLGVLVFLAHASIKKRLSKFASRDRMLLLSFFSLFYVAGMLLGAAFSFS